MKEENGHIWDTEDYESRCKKCQMKYGYYVAMERASEKQPERQDLKDLLKCKGREAKMKGKTVWIVFKTIPMEGSDFYAICRNEKIAEKARTKLAAILGEVETHFEIREIARDAVHPWGILCMDDSVDIRG